MLDLQRERYNKRVVQEMEVELSKPAVALLVEFLRSNAQQLRDEECASFAAWLRGNKREINVLKPSPVHAARSRSLSDPGAKCKPASEKQKSHKGGETLLKKIKQLSPKVRGLKQSARSTRPDSPASATWQAVEIKPPTSRSISPLSPPSSRNAKKELEKPEEVQERARKLMLVSSWEAFSWLEQHSEQREE